MSNAHAQVRLLQDNAGQNAADIVGSHADEGVIFHCAVALADAGVLDGGGWP
jgi:hypothetical protein